VSDALGTATELRAMKNYAGHRLSPWLGHLMVSRQETARPLLTPGEVMQLPPAEELILVSGLPPIRARKIRYFEDAQLQSRVGLAGAVPPLPLPGDDWSGLTPIGAPAGRAGKGVEDGAEGGLRREPQPLFEDAVEPPPPEQEFRFGEDDDDGDEGEAAQLRDVQRRFRRVARQAALDPDDGVEL
jgi:type IV secretion system protein VirD4